MNYFFYILYCYFYIFTLLEMATVNSENIVSSSQSRDDTFEQIAHSKAFESASKVYSEYMELSSRNGIPEDMAFYIAKLTADFVYRKSFCQALFVEKQAKPVESKLVDSKPADSKPEPTDSKPEPTESKSESTESKPVVEQGWTKVVNKKAKKPKRELKT